MELTLQEWIILIVAVAVLVSIIISVIKASLRLAVIAIIILCLFTGFTFLPEALVEKLGNNPIAEEYQNKMGDTPAPIDTTDAQEAIDKLGEGAGKAIDYVNQNKDSWINSAKSLYQKITGTYNEEGGD